MIVLTVDASGPGGFEAADLVQRGVASRVAVFAEPLDDVEREFSRRGLPYDDPAQRSVRRLSELGVFDRAMRGHPVQMRVRYSRYSEFDPDRRWRTREGVRREIVEIQKLLLDLILHPLS